MERASELKYLQWFFMNADFGPADSDVRQILNEQFKEKTGLDIPEEYEEEY